MQRVIDNAPRIIDNDFVRRLRPCIEEALHDQFYSDPSAAARYMAEDPDVAAHREDLEAKCSRLLEIRHRLDFSVEEAVPAEGPLSFNAATFLATSAASSQVRVYFTFHQGGCSSR